MGLLEHVAKTPRLLQGTIHRSSLQRADGDFYKIGRLLGYNT